MTSDSEKTSLEYIERTKAMETRMRNIFIGSMGLSLLVCFVFLFISLRGLVSGIVKVSFPPMLLWSFGVTGYAFHSLCRLAIERRQLLEDCLITDARTGVKSLSYISAVLQKEYEKMIQTGQPAAVLYVDLESLDVVNQKFGHAVGDVVLKEVAKVIERSVPEDGVVGHAAGDEFVVVLPETKVEKAETVAAAIEKSVRDYRFEFGEKGTVDFLDCRVGIIASPKGGGLADEIIGAAQQAAAKPRANVGRAESIRARVRGGA